MALLKFSLKTNIVKSIYSAIVSKTSAYYYTYGQTKEWPTVLDPISGDVISSETLLPLPVDSQAFEIETRKNMVYMKLIDSNDAAVVVRRVNWTIGTVYDMYDDYSPDNLAASGATSLQTSNYYVLTPDYNVYKCLYNNKGGSSLIQPVGTSLNQFETSDKYVWKFMYTIPLYLRQKFLNSLWMPVTTALSNQFYSNGAIIDYTIENAGAGYVNTTWKVKAINVINGGSGYVDGDAIAFDIPAAGVQATASIVVDVLGGVASVTITEPGSGYTSQPAIASITTTAGTNFVYDIEYERENTVVGSYWTEAVITGDGFNEKNPYSIKGDTIIPIDGGSFTAPVVGDIFSFPVPEKAYGRQPILVPHYAGASAPYTIDYVEIVDPGYGYTVPLVFGTNVTAPALTSQGFNCTFGTVAEQKNEAVLVPGIGTDGTLHAISLIDSGIGYTYANVDIKLWKMTESGPVEIDEAATSGPTYKDGFSKATVALNFSIGNIETKQSTVELLAVNGAISIIVVENGGSGFHTGDVVTAIGDGNDFSGTIVAGAGGAITGVDILNPGFDYTEVEFSIGDGLNTTGILRAVLPPVGGHGKDAVSELSAHTIMLSGRLGLEKIHQIDFNDVLDPLYYRQIGLLRDPYKYGHNLFYKNSIGSTTALIEVSKIGNDWYTSLAIGDTLYLSSDINKTYTVVGKKEFDTKYSIVVTMNTNHAPVTGTSLTFLSDSFVTIGYVAPEINKFTGELMYIDNRDKFLPTSDQTIITSTLISF